MVYKTMIVDGNNFLYRAYYAHKAISTSSPTTPVYQFMRMLRSLMEEFQPTSVFFTWDKQLNPAAVNFRKQLCPSYKANRVVSEDTASIHSYFQPLIDICDSLGIRTILPYDLEADDVIRELSILEDNGNTIVVSADRDLLQLVSDRVHHYLPSKGSKAGAIVTLDNFIEYAGCDRSHFILYKAILGDASDNVTGLYKYGPVKAKILSEKMYNQQIENANLSFDQLKTVNTNCLIMDLSVASQYRPSEHVHIKKQLDDSINNKFNREDFQNLMELHGNNNIIRQIADWGKLFGEETGNTLEDWINNISM